MRNKVARIYIRSEYQKLYYILKDNKRIACKDMHGHTPITNLKYAPGNKIIDQCTVVTLVMCHYN